MPSLGGHKFLAVENKSFDLISEGRLMDGMRICENGQGFRMSILLAKAEVDWLLGALEEFYWYNIKLPWARRFSRKNRIIWISFGKNRRGLYLVISKILKKARRIFIPEGY